MAARRRETNRWDAVINGVNYRLKRQEGAYRKVSGRSQLEVQQMLNQAGNQFTSRRDLRTLFQTDWSGGAQWQKPLLSDQSIDTYFDSTGFDLTREPGNIVPTPDVFRDTGGTDWDGAGRAPILQVEPDEIYFPVSGNDGSNDTIGKWNGASASTLSNKWNSGTGTDWYGFCWDNDNATIYGLNGTYVDYVTPDSASGRLVTHSQQISPGAAVFMHFGRLMVYTGNILFQIEDPLGTPAQTTIYDDQMGQDALYDAGAGVGSNTLFSRQATPLAVASSEGIWIVKNVYQKETIVPFVTRVDRTNDGTNVGVPVGSLPPGMIALAATYYLGSLIIAATSDLVPVFDNSIAGGYPEIVFYHLTNDSLGTIGSIRGGIVPDEAPFVFLGSYRNKLYIGGQKSIYAYDAVRGGFHKEFTSTDTVMPYWSMAVTTDDSDEEILLFTKQSDTDTGYVRYLKDEGGATDTHTLESNYIDGNLPAELKSLVGVTLMTDGIKTNETWTVTIEADDGSFAAAATFNTVGAKTTYKALASAITGYRFRYKIAYTASSDVTSPSRVKGIVLHMVQGEMVTAWQLTIDGTEMRSIENTVLRPEDALSDLETLMAKQTMTTFVDEMRVTASTHDVRVDSVQVSRSSPSEIEEAVVVLTEQDLDN